MSIKKQNLEQIFGREFKDVGDDYVALCPVHQEKTPSFYISKESGLVNCFGCKLSGRIAKVVENFKGVDENAALKLLGMSLQDLVDMEFMDLAPVEDRTFSEAYLALFERKIHKYVHERGFNIDTLKAAGSLYDKDTKRQVFPHRRRDGKLVGAIGRSCKEQLPKWHFYWNYQKGRHLYRAEVDDKPHTWIVEGVFDALWCYQHGLNAVAILGSKATNHQIEEIKNSYSTVVLALDNDDAGKEGNKLLYSRLKKSLTCLIPVWPEGTKDAMDVNPTDLELYNVVQWYLTIPSSENSGRVFS